MQKREHRGEWAVTRVEYRAEVTENKGKKKKGIEYGS